MNDFEKSRQGGGEIAPGSYEQQDISSLQGCVDDAFNALLVRCPEFGSDADRLDLTRSRLAQAVIEGKKLDLPHEELLRFALSAIPEGRRLWR
jgi:hypothetical protein